MARKYTKRDYGSLPLYQNKFSEKELREILNNVAATVNARIKNLNKETDEAAILFSELADKYNQLKSKHPEYFTASGNIRRQNKDLNLKQLEVAIDEITQLYLAPTIKQTKNEMEKGEITTNTVKHLIYKHGIDQVKEAISDKLVEKAQKKPSDDEEKIDLTEIYYESDDNDDVTPIASKMYEEPIGPQPLERLSKDELIDIIRRRL